MKNITIHSGNVDKIFKKLRKSIQKQPKFSGFLLPNSKRILSKRYRGKGRPRKSDYDYKKINYRKMFGISIN